MSETLNESATSLSPLEIKKVPEYHLKAAGFWTRFWAYLIDLVVISSITALTIGPLFDLMGWDDARILYLSPYKFVAAILFYGYFVLMTKWRAQTLGKMVFGIKVISDKGIPLTWGTILFREWIGRFISVKILILYIVAAFTPKHKAIHDYIADTAVVHEKSYEKIEKTIAIEQSAHTV